MPTNTNDAPDTRQTQADRIRALGGGGLPPAALEIAHDLELKTRAIRTDQRLTERYRQEQIATLEAEADAALGAARDRDIDAKMTEIGKREGALLRHIKGAEPPRDLTETNDERSERHFRANRDATTLLMDLMVVQALRDPSALRDVVDEAFESGRAERIQRLAPVALAQLEALRKADIAGAKDAYLAVFSQWDQYGRNNPSPMRQLRALHEERSVVRTQIERQYGTARQYLKIGPEAKHGLTL